MQRGSVLLPGGGGGGSQPKAEEESEVTKMFNSSNARTINGQMDWECGYCNMVNFARTVTCGGCGKHVDNKCKYITNRLKEIKYERYAQIYADDQQGEGFFAGRTVALPLPPSADKDRTQQDGSASGPRVDRASFHS